MNMFQFAFLWRKEWRFFFFESSAFLLSIHGILKENLVVHQEKPLIDYHLFPGLILLNQCISRFVLGMNNLVQNIATKTSVVVYYHPSLTKVFLETKQANVTQVEISIPHKLHNSIIGAKGRLIRSIMEECGGVSIKFPPEGGNSDKIIIRGPKDDADKAKKQLQQLANEKVQ